LWVRVPPLLPKVVKNYEKSFKIYPGSKARSLQNYLAHKKRHNDGSGYGIWSSHNSRHFLPVIRSNFKISFKLSINNQLLKMNWYIVQAYSGFERKVVESIKDLLTKNKLESNLDEILVPTHQVTEVKKGKRTKKEKKYFPGYVLVKIDLTKQIYHLIKNLQKVSGFLGSEDKPTPISDKEIQRILGQVSESAINQKSGISFEIGEKVKVCDGPFASFNGLVEEIDEEKSRLKVSVSIFGRPTPVDLEFNQVEKN
jgi:transcription termination/antitermination protein NusG